MLFANTRLYERHFCDAQILHNCYQILDSHEKGRLNHIGVLQTTKQQVQETAPIRFAIQDILEQLTSKGTKQVSWQMEQLEYLDTLCIVLW